MTHQFVHGPGSDDPLAALAPPGQGICGASAAYFVTLGNRLLDYRDANGMDCTSTTGWSRFGAFAGAVQNSYSFNASSSSDPDTKLSHFRNRHYSAEHGRFLQEDPIGFAGGLNLYAYAGNDPATYTDLFGLCPECRMGWGSPTAKNADREARYYASLTNQDRVGLLGLGLAAATGGFAVLATSSASAMTALALSSPAVGAGIQFAQKGISAAFRYGEFAKQSVSSVADGLRSGAISASQLPINVIIRDGVTYTLNNRSLMALRMAGLQPTVINNVTGNAYYEAQLTERLAEIAGRAPGFIPIIR